MVESSSTAATSIIKNSTLNENRTMSPARSENSVILSDGEEEDHVQRYGATNVRYIKRGKQSIWFSKPRALNFFKDGILYRTRDERSSTKLELFLDLMYVGLIANLAGEATKNASGLSLLKYFLFFIPLWQVWADIKDAVNYYYSEDLLQKLYIFWILCLLTLLVNSHSEVTESRNGAALTIVPYMICRLTLSVFYFIYSIHIPQHRVQMRLFATSIIFTSLLWIIVIFISNRAKIGVSIAIMVLETASFIICYHPWTKKKLKLRMSTALNIEHEVERMSTFVTIALGEFLYKAVANSPLGPGLSARFARGVFLILIAFNLFWIYNNGSTAKKSVHAIRRSASTAIGWIYSHVPLIACLVLAADAGGDLIASENTSTLKNQSHFGESNGELSEHLISRAIYVSRILYARASEGAEEEEKENMYALSFFFTGGICVALISMFIIGMMDRDMDPKGLHMLPRFWRIFWRVPIGLAIVFISFAELNTTVLMGVTAALVSALLIYESITLTPVTSIRFFCSLFPESAKKAKELELKMDQEETSEIQSDIDKLKQQQAQLIADRAIDQTLDDDDIERA